jgi:hypothetical protein
VLRAALLPFSSASLSESESLVSELSLESLEEEDPLPSFSAFLGAAPAAGAPGGARVGQQYSVGRAGHTENSKTPRGRDQGYCDCSHA